MRVISPLHVSQELDVLLDAVLHRGHRLCLCLDDCFQLCDQRWEILLNDRPENIKVDGVVAVYQPMTQVCHVTARVLAGGGTGTPLESVQRPHRQSPSTAPTPGSASCPYPDPSDNGYAPSPPLPGHGQACGAGAPWDHAVA